MRANFFVVSIYTATIAVSQVLPQTPHPATLFPLGGDKHSLSLMKLSDGSLLEVRMSNLHAGARAELPVFDRTELWLISPNQSSQLLFAEPSTWLEPKEAGSYGLIGILDAKLRGKELEVLLCRTKEAPDLYMSLYRFEGAAGKWAFTTGVGIEGTDRVHQRRVKSATLEERGKIRLSWQTGAEAVMEVADDGVVTLDGKVFWPGARIGEKSSPDMELEKEEMRGGYRVGNEIYYPRLLREMGVITDTSTPDTSTAQKTSPSPTTSSETQAPPNKAAVQAAAPRAPGTTWPWWLVSCSVVVLVLLFVRSRRHGGA